MPKAAKQLERWAKSLIPNGLRRAIKASYNLERRYGHWNSAARREAVDGQGKPVPWYTYPAIEYLKQLDFSDCDVFEFGSGNSTLFWGPRCRSLVSVEDDAVWYERVKPRLGANTTYLLEADRDKYPEAIGRFGRQFDVIVVDGSVRKRCGEAAVKHLKPGGLIVLDNSDWFPNTAAILRRAGLLQVDMHGFGPINSYTSTTSLFFHRAFDRKTTSGRQPDYSICGVRAVNDGS
ncbi:MAG TPA: hypothetical protein VEU47_01360 [Candidatus Cybelea sp.]|nr:hypothetical protein [Candidatus Cybelea sp.]